MHEDMLPHFPPVTAAELYADAKSLERRTNGVRSPASEEKNQESPNVYSVKVTERGLRTMIRLIAEARRHGCDAWPLPFRISANFLDLRLREGLAELLEREGRTQMDFDVMCDSKEVIDAAGDH